MYFKRMLKYDEKTATLQDIKNALAMFLKEGKYRKIIDLNNSIIVHWELTRNSWKN